MSEFVECRYGGEETLGRVCLLPIADRQAMPALCARCPIPHILAENEELGRSNEQLRGESDKFMKKVEEIERKTVEDMRDFYAGLSPENARCALLNFENAVREGNSGDIKKYEAVALSFFGYSSRQLAALDKAEEAMMGKVEEAEKRRLYWQNMLENFNEESSPDPGAVIEYYRLQIDSARYDLLKAKLEELIVDIAGQDVVKEEEFKINLKIQQILDEVEGKGESA